MVKVSVDSPAQFRSGRTLGGGLTEARTWQRALILRGVASIGFARIAAIVLDGWCYVLVARYLGPAEYGHYVAILAFLTLLDVAGDMTVLDITVREISSDPDRTDVWLCAGTTLRFAMTVLGFIAYVAYLYLGPVHRAPALIPAAWIAALVLPAGALRMPLAVFRARLKMQYELVIMVVTRLVNLLLFVTVMRHHGGISLLFLAVVASRAVLAIMCWASMLLLFRVGVRLDGRAVRQLIRESIPMALSGFFVAIQFKVDILMVSIIVGTSVAGLYGVVAQLPEYLLSVPVIISTPMLPFLSRVFAEEGETRFSELYQNLFDSIIAVAIPIFVVGSIMPRETVVFLFGEKFAQAAPVVPILMLTVVFMWASHAIAIAAVAAKLQASFVPIQAICVTAYVLLNWLLIPSLGMRGAAAARLLATVIAPVLTYRAVKRRTGLTLDARPSIRMAGAGGLMAVGMLATARSPLPLATTVGLALYAGALWACATRPAVSALARERA